MAIAVADNNGGRYNRVHRQTDDGIVISVASGEDLLPLVFTYRDYLGDCHQTLLAASFYPHKKLMRKDCGWRAKDDSVLTTFSWKALEHHTDGFTEIPSGELSEVWHDEPNCAKDVAICGHVGHRRTFFRKDREYWTPDHTLQAERYEDYFGWSQFNPNTCEPRKPNKCGLVEFKEKKHD